MAVYYVVSESLTNVAKHANASLARVALSVTDVSVVVEITDDGCGRADITAGTGVRGLADRVEALGGRLSLASTPVGGTLVRAELPL